MHSCYFIKLEIEHKHIQRNFPPPHLQTLLCKPLQLLHLFRQKNLGEHHIQAGLPHAVKQLMAFVDPPAQKKPLSDLLSCSTISIQCWNRLPLLYTWPGTNFVAALSTGNTGKRAGSLCYSNATLVISQLMSSPCYLSLQIHGFGAAAVVAAIF